jgi:hypothetical protein
MNDIKVGTFNAAAVAVNVPCGFVPEFVQIIDRATPSVSMGVPGGAVGVNIAAAAAAEAAALTVFEGEGTMFSLTGTLAATVDLAAVVGTSTLFTTELEVGEHIQIGGNVYEVIVITDATHLTLGKGILATVTADAYQRLEGRGAGFTVPAAYTANTTGICDFIATRSI